MILSNPCVRPTSAGAGLAALRVRTAGPLTHLFSQTGKKPYLAWWEEAFPGELARDSGAVQGKLRVGSENWMLRQEGTAQITPPPQVVWAPHSPYHLPLPAMREAPIIASGSPGAPPTSRTVGGGQIRPSWLPRPRPASHTFFCLVRPGAAPRPRPAPTRRPAPHPVHAPGSTHRTSAFSEPGGSRRRA